MIFNKHVFYVYLWVAKGHPALSAQPSNPHQVQLYNIQTTKQKKQLSQNKITFTRNICLWQT